MICEDARLHIGEPLEASPEVRQHLQGCAACSVFQREMTVLEGDIRKALELGPPLDRSRVPPRQRRASWSGWAIAASALLVVLAALTVWTLHPGASLAHEVVEHVALEPDSWRSSQQLPSATVDEVLHSAGVELVSGEDRVVYARTCLFRGHRVPHLVVQTWQGPVTVLILRNEHVNSAQTFQEEGFTGVLTPAPHGSIAVLAQGNEQVAEVAQQLRDSVRWLR